MITAAANGDAQGIAALAAAARSVAAACGALDDVAGLGVRLMADDALRRRTIREESNRLELTVDIVGTEVSVRLRDWAEPATSAPAPLLALVAAGLATAASTSVSDGSNIAEFNLPLPSHSKRFEATGVEVLDQEVPISDAPLEFMQLTAEHTPALTRCIYRCYGWSYPSSTMYYPDRIAAALAAGTRIGEIALDPDGEVAAHRGSVFLADGVVETGGSVTDPRYRRRGLANVLGDRLTERHAVLGVHAQLRRPVLTHSATQGIALRDGAVLVGLNVHDAPPLQQVGITDGFLAERASVAVFYSPTVPLEPDTLHVPSVYVPLVREVLLKADWPLTIAEPRTATDCAAHSQIASSYDHMTKVGLITVSVVGPDLVDVIDEIHTQLRRGGAEVVRVMLPLAQPATASMGAGLDRLGFAYAYLAPRYGQHGNVLVLQWLSSPTIDMTTWVYADAHVEHIAQLITTQIGEVQESAAALRRREARRLQLLAALPIAD